MSWISALANQDSKRWRNRGFARRFLNRNINQPETSFVYRGAFRGAMWRTLDEFEGHWVCWP